MNGTAVHPERRVVRGGPEVVLVGVVALVVLLASSMGVTGWLASGPRVQASGANGGATVPLGQERVLTNPLVVRGGSATVTSITLAHPDPAVSVTFALAGPTCPSLGLTTLDSLSARCVLRSTDGARILPGGSAGASPQTLVVLYALNAPVATRVPDVVVHYRSGWRTWTKALGMSICLTPPSLPGGCNSF